MRLGQLAILEQREEQWQQGFRQREMEDKARIALLVRKRQARVMEQKRRERKGGGVSHQCVFLLLFSLKCKLVPSHVVTFLKSRPVRSLL